MIVTTTPNIEGKEIVEYKDVVTGEAIIGANIVRDVFASIRDVLGGRAGSYEKALLDAKTIAMEEMKQRALELGANAVVGVDLDYEVLGANNSMLMVSASGTAVRVR